MGGKQSKRSVDISGKEGEAAAAGEGEVVAAGGEGRVEPLVDPDTLKPQLNGDAAHAQPPTPPEEITEKEKPLENGTGEKEDATPEKEAPTTNGAGDEQENGDAKPATDAEPKKNKKEKVKKKWSLRSISFSRKDKPKQEKKQKEEEPKTNGESDKLPEEGTEATAVAESKSSEDVKEVVTVEENKAEKTPVTPVTEPITNGSSAPETPKEETPVKENSPVPSPTVEKPVEQANEEPEKLAMNGLSLEDAKEEVPEVKIVEAAEIKVEEPAAPAAEELASTPDIPVATEVCVGQSPLTEPTPPPLPHNPPPSSVTAFAETTMAPHPVDVSFTPVSEVPDVTAAPEIAPSVGEAPLDSKLDSQLSENYIAPPQVTSLNDSAVDDPIVETDDASKSKVAETTNITPEIIAKDEPAAPKINDTPAPICEEAQEKKDSLKLTNGDHQLASIVPSGQDLPEATEVDKTSDPNEIKSVVPSKMSEIITESIAQVTDDKEVLEVISEVISNVEYKQNGLNNGEELSVSPKEEASESFIVSTEIAKSIVDSFDINPVDSSLQQSTPDMKTSFKIDEKSNGPTVEAELPAPSTPEMEHELISNETIPPPAKPEALPIALSHSVVESEETQSPVSPLSEAPPPPARDASESGEENRGSNEEVSGSFPLPPSELCPSESEASGVATPEPPQEAAPVVEKQVEISVPETLAEKTQLADIVEVRIAAAAPEPAAAAAGAGDGAPSD